MSRCIWRLASQVWPRARELKGFHRVTLAPGEEAEVIIALGVSELGVWSPSMTFDVEPGQLIMAGDHEVALVVAA